MGIESRRAFIELKCFKMHFQAQKAEQKNQKIWSFGYKHRKHGADPTRARG